MDNYNYVSIFHFLDCVDIKKRIVIFRHVGKADCFQMYANFSAKHNFNVLYYGHKTYTKEEYHEMHKTESEE